MFSRRNNKLKECGKSSATEIYITRSLTEWMYFVLSVPMAIMEKFGAGIPLRSRDDQS